MKSLKKILGIVAVVLIVGGCGGGGSSNGGGNSPTPNPTPKSKRIGYFSDIKGIQGVEYNTSSGLKGQTDEAGSFEYRDGDKVTFSIAEAELGTVNTKDKIGIFDFKKPDLVSQILYSFDDDKNPTNGININLKNSSDIDSKRYKKYGYRLKIDEVDSFNKEYISFLDLYSSNIIPKNKALSKVFLNTLKEVLKRNNISLKSPERKTVKNLALGIANPSDFSWINEQNEKVKDRIKDLYKINSLDYNTKLGALQTWYIGMVAKLSDKSEKVIDDAVSLDKEIKDLSLRVNTAMEMLFTSTENLKDAMKGKAALKEMAKKLANSGVQFGLTEYEIYGSGDGALELKMAANLLVNCTDIGGKTKSFKDCLIDSDSEFVGGLIEKHMDDGATFWGLNKEGAKDAVARAAKIGKMWVDCEFLKKAKTGAFEAVTGTLECFKSVVSNIFNNTYDLGTKVYQISVLNSDMDQVKAFKYAIDIFMAKEHLLPFKDDPDFSTSFYDDACAIIPFYSFDGKSQKEMHALKMDCHKEKSNYSKTKIILKAINNGKSPNIYVAKYTLNYLNKMKDLKDYKDLKDSYYNYYSKVINYKTKVEKDDTKLYVESLIDDLDIKKIETSYNEDGSYNISFAIKYRSDIGALKDIQPTILLKVNNEEYKPLKLNPFKDIAKEDVFIAKGENIKINSKATFILDAQMKFKLNSSANDYEYSKKLKKKYSILRKQSANLELSYSLDKKRTYTITASLEDYRDNKNNLYIYNWRIQDCKNLFKTTKKPFLEYSLSKNCSKIPTVKLEVFDDITKEFLVEEKVSLNPVLASSSDKLQILGSDKILSKDGEILTFTPKIVGGKVPYKIDAIFDSGSVKVKDGILTLNMVNKSSQPIEGRLSINITDDKVNHTSKEYIVKILPSDSISTIRFIGEEPNDGFNFQYSIQKQWTIKNTSKDTIKGVVLKWNKNISLSNLEHSKDDIEIGDIEPNKYKIINLEIEAGSAQEGVSNIGWYDIYFRDKSNNLQRLKYENNGIYAYIYYDLVVGTNSSIVPYITDVNVQNPNNSSIINGSFKVNSKDGKVKYLRVCFAPNSWFLKDEQECIDVYEGSYDSIQDTGVKHFSFDASKWTGKKVYWKIELANQYGTKKGDFITGFIFITSTNTKAELKYSKLSGEITDSSTDEYLPDVTVRILSIDRETKTDESGKFSFSILPPNSYTLEVSKDGYRTMKIPKVRVTEDKEKILNVHMSKITEDTNIKIADLATGYIKFIDKNYIPSDAWIRITPKQYQIDGNWNGLNCKIDSNGNFGSECYVDYDEEGIREAFSNSSTKYQIVVYKNHIEPNDHHWDCGEDAYKYVGDDLSNGEWSNITVKDEDYHDQKCSDESLKIINMSLNGNQFKAIFNKDMRETYHTEGDYEINPDGSYWTNKRTFVMNLNSYTSGGKLTLLASGFESEDRERLSQDKIFIFP